LIFIFLFGSFSIPRRHSLIGIAHATAYIHEAAAATVVKCTSATRMIRETGARGNKAADDNVLLQTPQIVLEAPDRRLGEDAGGFLERRRRNEGFRAREALVMPNSMGSQVDWFLPSALCFAMTSRSLPRSICSPRSSAESPVSSTSILRNICRTITSMCLSFIFPPCRR